MSEVSMTKTVLTLVAFASLAGTAISSGLWMRSRFVTDIVVITESRLTDTLIYSSDGQLALHREAGFAPDGGCMPRRYQTASAEPARAWNVAHFAGDADQSGALRPFSCSFRGIPVSDGSRALGFSLGISYWLVTLITLPGWLAFLAYRLRQSRRRDLCRKCGYDLRGTPDRCPECGTHTQPNLSGARREPPV